jgi:hypothetical protein
MTRSCSPVLTQMDSDDEHNQPFVIISQPPSPTLSSVSNLSSVESVFSLPEELAPFVSESTTTQLPAPVTITGVDIPGGDLLLQVRPGYSSFGINLTVLHNDRQRTQFIEYAGRISNTIRNPLILLSLLTMGS